MIHPVCRIDWRVTALPRRIPKLTTLLGASVLVIVSVACASPEFPTPLPTATPFVFPSPLPTATPAPTATPIVLPSPLPTATPQAVVYPTPLPTATPAPTATPVVLPSPLPTATPVVLPTPLPTPTPQSFVFPTPLPTATPVVLPTPLPTPTPTSSGMAGREDAFAELDEVMRKGVITSGVADVYGPVSGGTYQGTAFAFMTSRCPQRYCLLTAAHLQVRNSVHIRRTRWNNHKSDDDLDVAVLTSLPNNSHTMRKWEIAPESYRLQVGEPVRLIAIDYDKPEPIDEKRILQVSNGIVSYIDAAEERFIFTAPVQQGNSGGLIVNGEMQVVGMFTGFEWGNESTYPTGYRAYFPAPGRSYALHFKAIRAQLREWGLLD